MYRRRRRVRFMLRNNGIRRLRLLIPILCGNRVALCIMGCLHLRTLVQVSQEREQSPTGIVLYDKSVNLRRMVQM